MKRAVALVLITGGMMWPAAPAPARALQGYDGACTDDVGVTVVVDFQELGGGVNVRCTTGDVTNGLDALDKAGISWQGTVRFPSFVCRIAGKPGADSDPCVNTSPATAFWSYWVAPRGGAWCYSSFGAAYRTPPPGTVEGWSFAKNRTSTPIPPPGADPPPPPEGQSAHPLNPSDCPASEPVTTTTTTSPPTPATAAAPSTATTSVAPAATPATAPTPRTVTTRATPAPASSAPETTSAVAASTSADATTTSTTMSAAPTTTTSIESGGSTTTRSLGAVDLSNSGQKGGGVSAFTVLAVLGMLALVATAVVLARRRRTASP